MLTPIIIQKLRKLEIILEVSLADELNTSIVINTSLERTKDMWTLLDESDKKYIFATLREIVREEEMVAKLLLGNCVKLLDSISYTQKLMG